MKVFAVLSGYVLANCGENEELLDGTCYQLGGPGTPCPSSCWLWNPTNNACMIREDTNCFTLLCQHDEMVVKFAPELFALPDSATASDFSTDAEAQWIDMGSGDGEWGFICPLGECEMTAEYDEVADKLKFSVPVSKAMQSLELDGEDIHFDPVDAQVTFTCTYDASYTLSSDDFMVHGADAEGEITEDGDLSDGFDLSLYVDESMSTLVNDENVYVGYPVYARVSWEVTSAQEMVNFYVSDCSVIHDSRSISLIKNTCYSSVLGAAQMQSAKIVSAESNFQFTAFTFGNAPGTYSMETKVMCDIKLCLKGNNCSGIDTSLPAIDSECTGDANYVFKALSYEP